MTRLLLVEDDRQLRTSVARGLQEAAYDVVTASSGTDALALLEAQSFDVIVLDILLPGASGIDVCRSLRARGNGVPILMLTALDSVEQRIAGLDEGADDYLTKPFDFGELLARVRAIVRRHGDTVPASLVVGDLEIDMRQHRVYRGNREIALTAKEFSFLAYLARHAGTIVSRADLMTHVWEDSRSTFSNIIDVYASRLRKKIDEGDVLPMFVTVRGAGFLLATAESARRAPSLTPG